MINAWRSGRHIICNDGVDGVIGSWRDLTRNGDRLMGPRPPFQFLVSKEIIDKLLMGTLEYAILQEDFITMSYFCTDTLMDETFRYRIIDDIRWSDVPESGPSNLLLVRRCEVQ